MENKESIKNKIKALLEKTEDNGATKAEAEAALTKAKDLMAAYFISEHDIKDSYAYKTCVFKRITKYKSGYTIDSFIIQMARLFDCLVYVQGKEIVFYGFEQDVDLCEYFFHYLTRVILHEKDMYMMSLEAMELKDRNIPTKSIISCFLFGFQQGLREKLESLYLQRNKQIHEESGLVVFDKINNVEQQLSKIGIKIKYSNRKVLLKSEEAQQEGYDKGLQIDLHQGLKDKRTSTRYLS